MSLAPQEKDLSEVSPCGPLPFDARQQRNVAASIGESDASTVSQGLSSQHHPVPSSASYLVQEDTQSSLPVSQSNTTARLDDVQVEQVLPSPILNERLASVGPSASGSTFTGLATPLLHYSFCFGMRLVVRALGYHVVRIVESAFLRLLFMIDALNPIAWAKLLVWYSHPARFADRPWGLWTLPFLRMIFLTAATLKVFVQYCGLLLIPLDSLKSTFVLVVMADAFTDGIKYAGFTNSILLTFLLSRRPAKFGKSLINTSRQYMEDVQYVACIVGPVLLFVIQMDRLIVWLHVMWTMFLWIDFILKRVRHPRNCVRRRISVVAHQAQNNLYPELLGGSDSGFAVREKERWQMEFYAAFFIINAAFKAMMYTPLLNAMVTLLGQSS